MPGQTCAGREAEKSRSSPAALPARWRRRRQLSSKQERRHILRTRRVARTDRPSVVEIECHCDGSSMSDVKSPYRAVDPGDVSATLGGIATQMLDTDDLALWYALNRLMTNYWADVDSNGGAQAHEFYLPDALYAVGNNRFEGEQKIRAFYARRRQRGRTTTRHLVDNLRVFREDARRARAVGVMSLYRADGNPPFQGARPPAMIADFEAQCVLGDDQLWRFQSHVLRPIFVGSDVPISLTIDPRHL